MDLERSRKEDADLVSKIRRGDPQAENRLTAKYNLKILYFARRKLPTAEDSEDIRQETMLAVIKAVREGRIRDPQNTSSFIYRVCSNKVIDFRKKPSRHIPLDKVREAELCPTPPEDDRLSNGTRAVLDAAWKELPLVDRRILYLKYLRKMKYEDIARILGLSSQALKKRAQRAKEKMRSGLK